MYNGIMFTLISYQYKVSIIFFYIYNRILYYKFTFNTFKSCT